MITARNYAAQAERALLQMIGNEDNIYKKTSLAEMYNNINKGQHFLLPNNGLILNNKGVTLYELTLHLPFPKMTIEFHIENSVYDRAVSIYRELPNGIYCNLMIYNKNWALVPFGIFINEECGPKKSGFIFQRTNMLGYETSKDENQGLEKETIEPLRAMMLTPIQELLEALSCNNVYTETLGEFNHKKKNDKLIKQGKLPSYETKILVVDSSAKLVDKTDLGGTHASPRQHLRRGHIRRYSTYNIWINNQVIGKASDGIIEKSYEVK